MRSIISLFCAFALSIFSFPQESSECLAVITDLDGDVTVIKASANKVKAVWGVQLFEGDKITTAKNSRVALLFSNGNLINLGANSDLEISGPEKSSANSTAEPKKVNTAMMANFSALTFRRKEEKEIGVIAGLRDGDNDRPIVLISPCNTIIRETAPAFYWQPGTQMEQYLVKLYNSKGMVWSKKAEDSKLLYPADEKALEPGESYFWNVEGEIRLELFKSPNREFTILSLDEQKILDEQKESIKELFRNNPNSSGYHSLLGACYMNIGLYENAINEFREVSEINPDSALPHEILGNLYTITGNKDRAISELQKALEIKKREE